MSDVYQERVLQKEFEEIRARYTELLKEVLATTSTVPDWLLNPRAGCACGDKCSTGTTDLDRLSEVINPAEKALTK